MRNPLSSIIFEGESAVVSQTFRIANIERLRILAIFGIIWFHTEGAVGRSIGYAGLPIFIMIFCALAAQKSKPDDFVPFARKKARRLLIPWLFWSIVYIVCKALKQSLSGADISETFGEFSIFVGAKIHLWYLPFAFVCGLVINLLHRQTMRISSAVTILAAAIVGVLGLFCCSVTMSLTDLPVPVPQWLFGLPGIALGFAVGRAGSSLKRGLQKKFCLGIVLAVEGMCLLLFCLGYGHMVVPYGIAMVLVCAAFLSTQRSNVQLLKFSSLAYGIYLVHPLVDSVLQTAGIVSDNPLIMAMMIFVVSSITILVMQKTPLRPFV